MPETFTSTDGVTLSFQQLGAGRPIVLLHGYLQTATKAWIESDIAARLVAEGYRVVMPDLRGHGASNPHGAFPPDALTTDALALIAHLRLEDYDLGGYSLGGRIAARAMALGAEPRRAVVGGTGLQPILNAAGRGGNYKRILSNLGTFTPGSFEALIEEHLRQIDADPDALMRVFDTLVDTPAELLARVEVPTLVITGTQDTERGSAEELAALLAHGQALRVPGNHGTAMHAPEFIEAVVRFLAEAA